VIQRNCFKLSSIEGTTARIINDVLSSSKQVLLFRIYVRCNYAANAFFLLKNGTERVPFLLLITQDSLIDKPDLSGAYFLKNISHFSLLFWLYMRFDCRP